MKIAVCLKRVPDTVAKIVPGPDRKSIDETGIKFVLNPYDEFAVEEALARKEKAGAGETVAYAVGTDASQETLRTALAMGIDRAVRRVSWVASVPTAYATVSPAPAFSFRARASSTANSS